MNFCRAASDPERRPSRRFPAIAPSAAARVAMNPSGGSISSRAGAGTDPATDATRVPRPAGPCPPPPALSFGAEPPSRWERGCRGSCPGVGLEQPRVDPARGVLGVSSGAGRPPAARPSGPEGTKWGYPGAEQNGSNTPLSPQRRLGRGGMAGDVWLRGALCPQAAVSAADGACEPFLGCNCGGKTRSVTRGDATLLQDIPGDTATVVCCHCLRTWLGLAAMLTWSRYPPGRGPAAGSGDGALLPW